MPEMVWCRACKTVVWAYDDQPCIDLRGIFNMMSMPCPKCGELRNFDGWGSDRITNLIERHPGEVYDGWSALKYMAKANGIHKWEISPDCSWFKRPNYSDVDYKALMIDITRSIQETVHQALLLEAAKLAYQEGQKEIK